MAETEKRPRRIPKPTSLTRPFWDAANEGRLVLQYDPEAGKYQFWPRPVSIHTGKANLEWREVSGKGKLYAYTVNDVPARGYEDLAPYVLGCVELDEGVRIMARLVNVTPEEVRPGMRLGVCWERLDDDINLFLFEPIG
jgi:hypothetical protein